MLVWPPVGTATSLVAFVFLQLATGAALANEVICHGVPSDLATVRYRLYGDRRVSVDVELPRIVVWSSGEYVKGTRDEPGAFEFASLKLLATPEDGGTKGLGLRAELETHIAREDGGVAPPEDTVTVNFDLENHEGSVVRLTGIYWSVQDELESGCVSHMVIEIAPPSTTVQPRSSRGTISTPSTRSLETTMVLERSPGAMKSMYRGEAAA